jgi:hypothetical protein
MFVRGNPSVRSPYSIKLLTKLKLLSLVMNRRDPNSSAELRDKITYERLKLIEFFLNLLTTFTFTDSPYPYQIGFQDPATELMEGIIDLHHDVIFFLILVVVVVAYILFRLVIGQGLKNNVEKASQIYLHNKLMPTKIQHNALIEIV